MSVWRLSIWLVIWLVKHVKSECKTGPPIHPISMSLTINVRISDLYAAFILVRRSPHCRFTQGTLLAVS